MGDTLVFDTPSVPPRESGRSHLATSLAFELQQMTELLSQNLAEEEGRALTRDLADAKYPMTARALRARIANLQRTILTLKAAA